MATRKAYIDWKKLGPDTVLENRKLYMVCQADGDTCVMRFAHYYDAGTVIDIGLADGVDIGKEPTAEEQLLACIFGRSRTFVVPEDGFYLRTADYGVDEKEYNGAFENCREQAVCVGNRHGWEEDRTDACPAYWAEVPVLPDGLRLNGEVTYNSYRPESYSGKAKEAEARLERDPLAATVYHYVWKDTPLDGPSIDRPFGKAIYSTSPLWFATALLDAHAMCQALGRAGDEALLAFDESLKPVTDQDEVMRMVEAFCREHGIPENLRWFMFQYIRYVKEDFRGFYEHRDKILRAGGTHSLNLPAVLQEAQALYKIQFWVGRCVKLEQMSAPEVILANELRMLVEYLAMFRLSRNMVCVRPDFNWAYGVNPDGSRGDGWCEFGDMELEQLPQPVPEGCEADDDDCGSEDEPEDEEPKVIGVDYPYFAGVPAPNFLMRKCRYVIWDNAAHRYLRGADGQVEQFAKFPRERLAELNQAAKEAAEA